MRIGIFSTDNLTERAAAVGCDLIRPLAVYANESHLVTRYGEVEAIADSAGAFSLFLTIRANRKKTAPTRWKDYAQQLERILEKYQPAYVAIENEAQDRERYYTGASWQYLKQVHTAADVIARHGFPTLLTDSGFTSESLEAYFTRKEQPGKPLPQGYAFIDLVLMGLKDNGADYANMHLYQPKPGKVGQLARRVQETTGLPILSNEFGQWRVRNGIPDPTGEADPDELVAKLEAAEAAGFAVVVWFCQTTREGELYGAAYTPASEAALRGWVQQAALRGPI